MQLFIASLSDEGTAVIRDAEARHCTKVMRLKVGDTVACTDGQGLMMKGIIVSAGRDEVHVNIAERTAHEPQPSLHLAIAPTKNIARFEWFLEKATEAGISAITPLICKHSERRTLRADRLEKVVETAMKQSLQVFMPELNPLTDLVEFAESVKDSKGERFIASTLAKPEVELFMKHTPGHDVIVMIGPEGDFSAEELELTSHFGFVPVSLGPVRLRVETAGILAVHSIQLKRRLDQLNMK